MASPRIPCWAVSFTSITGSHEVRSSFRAPQVYVLSLDGTVGPQIAQEWWIAGAWSPSGQFIALGVTQVYNVETGVTTETGLEAYRDIASWRPLDGNQTPVFRALSDGEIDERIQPLLRSSDEIAHAVFEGPFGPAPDVVVAVVDRGTEGYGAVVISEGGAVWLNRLRPNWMAWEIPAILFEDVDGDGNLEAIVLAQYITGIGPTGAVPFHSNSVLDWTGDALVTLPAVEARIEDAASAAAVRALLEGS